MSWLAGTPFEIIPDATLGGLVAGAALPVLGVWVVLQRVVFLGVALAQVAAAGVALGLFLDVPPLPLGFALALLTAVPFTRADRGRGRAATDARLGAAFCGASALALLFISRSPAEMDEVHHVLHGNLIYASRGDVLAMAVTALAGLLVVGLATPRILFSAFDRETARAMGMRPRAWLLLLFAVLAAVLTLSMRTTGSLLAFALLVLPPMTALPFARGMRSLFALSSALGVAGTACGLLVAIVADLHLESAVVVTLFALLVLGTLARVHPLLALAVAAAIVALVPRLAPDEAGRPAEQGHGHEARIGSHASHPVLAEPYHLDLLLDVTAVESLPDGRTRIAYAWTLELHRHDREAALPPALWLVLLLDGHPADERVLVTDTAGLGQDATLRGDGEVMVDEPPREFATQLWTAPTRDVTAEPVRYSDLARGVVGE